MCTSQNIKNILDNIKKDNLSGSGTLLQNLIVQLLECTGSNTSFSPGDVHGILNLFYSFRKEMADFAVITHFCNFITEQIQTKDPQNSKFLYRLIREYSQQWSNVNKDIADNFIQTTDISNKTVLLHSQSSAVITLFRELKSQNKNIKIIQTESRPMYEGRQQASKLAAIGYSVKIVTDTGFTPLLNEIDVTILGADRIFEDVFINKCGTHSIALICRQRNIPVYVLADSRKIVNTPFPASNPEKMRPAHEIWEDPPAGITPVNFYFEAVPVILANKFITEKNKIK